MDCFRTLLACWMAFCLASPFAALGADLSAQASLSDTAVAEGESVELSVTVRGSRGAQLKKQVAVDGLNIRQAGQRTQMNMTNFQVDVSVTLSFVVTPLRAGEFVIPPIEVEAGGKTLATEPLRLAVSPSGPAASGGGSAAQTAPGGQGGQGGGFDKEGGSGDLVFAELVPTRERAYVGEAVPVDLNIFVDSRVRWEMQRPPEIVGEGFTVSKLGQKRPRVVSRGGRQYDQLTFSAILSPLKAGELTVGPIDVRLVAEIPQRRTRSRQIPGFPDNRFDNLFDDFFGSISIPQEVAVAAPPATLSVKPLPSEGRPPGFAGAVGRFSLSSDASPVRVKPGDPVTVKLAIEGEGNFDLVKVPQMIADPKWRSYPPSESFEEQEGLGLRGVKRFDLALIPEAGAGPLPMFEFSYFDPATERYETARTGGLAVTVEGPAPADAAPRTAAATPSAATPAASTPAATPTPTPAKPEDILFIRTEGPGRRGTFEPLHRRPAFWLWQIPAALAAAGLLLRRFLAARAARVDRAAAGWRAEQERLAASIRSDGIARDRFLEDAVRWVRLEAALRTRCNPDSVTRQEAAALPGLDEEQRRALGDLFSAWEELRFSGGGASGGPVPASERDRVLGWIGRIGR